MMVERLLILLVAVVVLVAVYRVVTHWQLRRTQGDARSADPLLHAVDWSRPTVVYFTTPMCAVCRTTQRPALDRLRDTQPVNVVQVDATEDPDAALRWGVLTAPTTFVLDASGRPARVNNGVADERKLTQQIEAVYTA